MTGGEGTSVPRSAAAAVGVRVRGVEIEARIVEPTGFGRWAVGSRRVVDDVDGPTGWPPRGSEAAEAWIGSVASAVERLLFGLGSRGAGPVAVGVSAEGAEAETPTTLDLTEPRGLAIEDGGERLVRALACRSIDVRAVLLPEPVAWALGEVHSGLGSLTSQGSSLLVHWDRDATLVKVDGEGQMEVLEVLGAGFAGVEETLHGRGIQDAEGRILSRIRAGDREVTRALREAGTHLGRRVASACRSARRKDRSVTRVVLAGRLGRTGLDPRLAEVTLGALGDTFAREFAGQDSPLPEGFLMVSREDAACQIGAAAHAAALLPFPPADT